MSFSSPDFSDFAHAAERAELLASLERALDHAYDQIRRVARQQWEHHFSYGSEENACISVRVGKMNRGTSSRTDRAPRAGHAKMKRATAYLPNAAGFKSNGRFKLR